MSATILLIDDEKLVRESLERFLDFCGYRVLTACDGEEGVEIFRRMAGSVDLVILDWILPGRGGAWTLEALRDAAPDCRVVLFSGHNEGWEGVAADDLIFKPVAMPELLERIRVVLADENVCLTGE